LAGRKQALSFFGDMIEKYLKGLPYTLTQPMYREYEAKSRELSRWRERSSSARMRPYLNQLGVLEELIALGIYYRYVVAPLASSADFFGRLESSNEGVDLKVGGKRIDGEFRNRIDRGVNRFAAITRNFGLPAYLFSEGDVSAFVRNLVTIEERRSRDAD
jgi:hypothetical protein